MTPSWYDLLGVEPDASPDEVRAAWRGAVADLDPTDRRFAVLNRAAKVLLDPERRAAYDAELAAQDEDVDDGEEVEGVENGGEPAGPVVAPVDPREDTDGTAVPGDPGPDPGDPGGDPDETGGPARRGGSRASLLTTVLVGITAVALAVIAAIAWSSSTSEALLEEEVAAARVAAEQAVVPVLSYDATDLEAGRSAATSYLTDDFREQYEQLFDGLIQGNAAEIGARVETTFVSSAVVRSDTGGDRVQVLVFFDQATTNDTTAEPRVANNQATFTMELVGDRWLVDDIETGFGD